MWIKFVYFLDTAEIVTGHRSLRSGTKKLNVKTYYIFIKVFKFMIKLNKKITILKVLKFQKSIKS